jgi:precorrin-6Y C5,15-methyltransferase (decarboxylating)
VTGERIPVVGLLGGQWFGRDAEAALRSADVLLGHADQFALLDLTIPGERVELWGDLEAVLDRAEAERDAGRRPCILAAGDPGFHGLVRVAARRLGPAGLEVHPAPSSVAVAFARLGDAWDDAVVASTHGRDAGEVVAAVAGNPKVAVLTSHRLPPAALGAALVAAGCPDRDVAVCSRLCEPAERVVRTDLAGLAAGDFDHLSVVVLRARATGPEAGPLT